MCDLLRILPLNHCIYNEKHFDGNFTYFKANIKSQIDFVLTNNLGRSMVKKFEIIQTGWHFSDHVPTNLNISLTWNIALNSVLRRSKGLLHWDPSTTAKSLKTFKYQFHLENAQTMLRQKSDIIINECSNQTTGDLILQSIYRSINPILESTKISIKNVKNKNNEFSTKTCDDSFLKYTDMLNCPSSNNSLIRSVSTPQESTSC